VTNASGRKMVATAEKRFIMSLVRLLTALASSVF
jgi:hypothetical protein